MTLDERYDDELAFFQLLFTISHPNLTKVEYEMGYKMFNKGEIAVESMLENALSALGGPKKMSVHYMDFSDGSDAKKSCTRTRNYGKNYDAQVSNIKKKVGDLRVVVYERKQKIFRFFFIPYSEYRNMSSIEIPFNLDGTPKRVTRRGVQKWWKFEVSSLQELALMKSVV
jgi:hypothetical protein